MNFWRTRILFTAISAFWLAMNFLLYRYEWGEHTGLAAAIPLQTVWEKILNSPDVSSLDVFYGPAKVGYARWAAGTTDQPLIGNAVLNQEFQPGTVAEKPSGYGLTFEGSVLLGSENRLRFQSKLMLDTNEAWQDLRVHTSVRPNSWDLTALAADQTVTLKGRDASGVWKKTLTRADLQNPGHWLGDFVDPSVLGLLGLDHDAPVLPGAGLVWEAHEARMKLGRSNIRVYRLDTTVAGQRIEVMVSRAGEILQVDLPFQVTLRNQALSLAPGGKG